MLYLDEFLIKIYINVFLKEVEWKSMKGINFKIYLLIKYYFFSRKNLEELNYIFYITVIYYGKCYIFSLFGILKKLINLTIYLKFKVLGSYYFYYWILKKY